MTQFHGKRCRAFQSISIASPSRCAARSTIAYDVQLCGLDGAHSNASSIRDKARLARAASARMIDIARLLNDLLINPASPVAFAYLRWWSRNTENAGVSHISGLLWIRLALSLIHISEPTRLGMISYAVFCLKK